MVLPNALIIGAQKAGTTTLYDMIGQHPDVYANPLAKDCEFFGIDREYNRGVNYYSRLFRKAHKEKIVLGGNATDLFMPNSIERIHNLLPECKLIVILRDPVQRAFSAYRYALERGTEQRPFLIAVQEELAGADYDTPYDARRKSYVAQGHYDEQIERCLQFFKTEQILILLQDDLIREPSQVMYKVFHFLGVDVNFDVNAVKKNETLGGSRFGVLNRVIYDSPFRQRLGWEKVRLLIPKSFRYKLREGMIKLNRVPSEAPQLEKEVVDLLRHHYRDDIERLEKITGYDLDKWK
jgi:hypothetical protein